MKSGAILLGLVITLLAPLAMADDHVGEFSQWAAEYEAVVEQGENLFTDPFFSENGKSCAQCHPKAKNTHPESYPKYRKSQQRVIQLWEMVNWCVDKALGKKPLEARDPDLTALVTYVTHANTGATLSPGTP